MVFPHRECGCAAVAAPIPVYAWDFFRDDFSSLRSGGKWTKQRPGLTRPTGASSWGGGELRALRGRLLEPGRELLNVRNDARVGGQPKVRVAVVRDDRDPETHRRVKRCERPHLEQLRAA